MASPGSTAARRYAEAAFQLATRDKALDEYGDGLDLAAGTLSEATVLNVVRNPARPLAQRLEVVDAFLAKQVPAPILKLVGLLVQRGRIDQVGTVAAEYRRLLNRERGIVEAVAKTPLPLSAEETEALRKKVAEMTGQTVDLRVEIDESLIGGLTVRVRDTLYDPSVRGRLERLRQRLAAGAK